MLNYNNIRGIRKYQDLQTKEFNKFVSEIKDLKFKAEAKQYLNTMKSYKKLNDITKDALLFFVDKYFNEDIYLNRIYIELVDNIKDANMFRNPNKYIEDFKVVLFYSDITHVDIYFALIFKSLGDFSECEVGMCYSFKDMEHFKCQTIRTRTVYLKDVYEDMKIRLKEIADSMFIDMKDVSNKKVLENDIEEKIHNYFANNELFLKQFR